MECANRVCQIDSFSYPSTDDVDVHLMPCRIDFDGTAKVEQYFTPGIMRSCDPNTAIDDSEGMMLNKTV